MKEKIVIKLGGAALSAPETLRELTKLVKGLVLEEKDVVIVHGGGPAINAELTRRGISWKFIEGQRQTTPEMMEVIDHVLSDEVNSQIVESLLVHGVKARGLSGARDGILICNPENTELMRVGRIEYLNLNPVWSLLDDEQTVVPVIAPTGVGIAGDKFNVNADLAAANVAMALGARTLIFLTDQVGILDGNKNHLTHVNPSTIGKMIRSGEISGGMLTKVRAMLSALDSGIGSVRVLKACDAGELLCKDEIGTTLIKDFFETQERMHA